MDWFITLAYLAILGTTAAISGYWLMRQKLRAELAKGRQREKELARGAYETAVLAEIGERIGYSLNTAKIVELIGRSLGRLLPYSTVSYMILDEGDQKIRFDCNVHQSVSGQFVAEVKTKMLAALSEMLQEPLTDIDVDQRISGAILDETEEAPVRSFFNLPIIISGKVAGLINVASKDPGLYDEENTGVLYRIARQASAAVSKLQEVLETEKSKLSQAVESLADGLLMVDMNYQVVLTNKKLVELLGIVPNPKIFDIVNALSGNLDIRTKMEEAIAKDEPLESQTVTIGNKVLEISVAKVVNVRNQKPMGVVALFHDITDAKALEKLRQDFTAMMVHELRAPLTTIKSTAEMAKTNLASAKVEDLGHHLTLIDSTAQNMLGLVNDLLDVAKLEAGKFDVICEPGDLGKAILERVESFQAQAAAKNLRLNVDMEKDLPEAYFDKIRIKQVLNNLLSNAIKYTETGGITVKAAKEIIDGKMVDILVSVGDTGIGIEADQIPRLFSKFGQLENGRNLTGGKGAGLGLYISRSIIEAMGGKIWVESEGAGMGSTFYFTVLPTEGKEKSINDSNNLDLTGEKGAQA